SPFFLTKAVTLSAVSLELASRAITAAWPSYSLHNLASRCSTSRQLWQVVHQNERTTTPFLVQLSSFCNSLSLTLLPSGVRTEKSGTLSPTLTLPCGAVSLS